MPNGDVFIDDTTQREATLAKIAKIPGIQIRFGKYLPALDEFRPQVLEESTAPVQQRQTVVNGQVVTVVTPSRAPSAPAPSAPKAPGKKRTGKCSFIDDLIMEGKYSKEQILEKVLKQFPGEDSKGTLATIACRPSHIKAKGLVPPPFKS